MTSLCERCHENEPAHNDEWCPDCIFEVELAIAEKLEEEPTETVFRRFPPGIGRNGQYTLEDLEVRVAEYEEEYGLPSDALLEMHRQNRTPIDVSHFDRHVWLSMYREILEARL